jgi:hypothetical protein
MTAHRAPNGWIIDGDGWFVRAMRPGDVEMTYRPKFGFTCEGTVFVCKPQHCHDYDQGVVTPLMREGAR